jgi:anti-sigma-K factor RskA
MTCTDFKDSVGAFAAGALEPAEREACERHLAESVPHEGCAEALKVANDAAALLGVALAPVEPRPDLWRAIEAQIAPRPTVVSTRPRRGQRVAWMAAGFAAAAALAGVAVFGISERSLQAELEGRISQLETQVKGSQGATATCQRDLESARADLVTQHEALAMLQLSTTAVIAMAPQGGAEKMHASAIYNPQQRHAMVVASGFMPHAGKDYELWVIRGNDKIAAGLLHGDASGTLVARVDTRLLASGAPDAFAITLEPKGGGIAPRGPIMLVGALSKG